MTPTGVPSTSSRRSGPTPVQPPGDDGGSVPTGLSRFQLDALFEARAASVRARHDERLARRRLWLSHHWPAHYAERCATVGGRPVCRRCLALYPLSILVAVLALVVGPPWPAPWDPWPVWLLSLPATVAFVGEALGWFRYSVRWQVGTMLVAAVAFGRAWGAEMGDGGQAMFWGPIAVFGGLWFAASAVGHVRRTRTGRPTA